MVERRRLKRVVLRQAGVRVANRVVNTVALERRREAQPGRALVRLRHAHHTPFEPPQELLLLRKREPLPRVFAPLVPPKRPWPRRLLLLPLGEQVVPRVVAALQKTVAR